MVRRCDLRLLRFSSMFQFHRSSRSADKLNLIQRQMQASSAKAEALEDRLPAARLKPEWGVLLRELDRLQEIETEQEGKHFVLRTPVTGDVGRVFRALGIALPPNIREADVTALID